MFKKLFRSFSFRYLSYSKSELRGSLALLFLLSVQLLFLFFTRNVDTGRAEPRITVIELPPDEIPVPESRQTNGSHVTKNLTHFDPNTAEASVLTAYGLSTNIAQRIIRYRNKGGKFLKAEDLLMIYGLDRATYELIEPYVKIPETPSVLQRNSKGQDIIRKRSLKVVELNQADSADLEALPMIGPKRASMIIKYRNILGGFVDKGQLLEVYSIDSAVYQVIMDKVKADPGLVQPIAINRIQADSLYHPYLTRKQSGMIMNYRNNHGNFTDHKTVCRAALLNDKLCAKIAPYLTLD